MEIVEDKVRGVTVRAPIGRVDSTNAPALEQALFAAVKAGERQIVLDFAGVDYISSAGLRVLLLMARRMKEEKGAWALCALGDPVRQVFELTGFLPLFTIEATRSAAIARVGGA